MPVIFVCHGCGSPDVCQASLICPACNASDFVGVMVEKGTTKEELKDLYRRKALRRLVGGED